MLRIAPEHFVAASMLSVISFASVLAAAPTRAERVAECLRTVLRAEVAWGDGKHDDAIAEYRKVLQFQEELYGPDSVESGGTHEFMAKVHEQHGDFAAAETARQTALRIARRRFGDKHYRVTDARLAETQGKRYAALTAEQRKRVNEADRTLAQADVLERRKRLVEAKPLAVKAVDAFREVLGEESPKTIEARLVLARLFGEGADDAAEANLKPVVEACRKTCGDHPHALAALTAAAALQEKRRNFDAALPLRKESVDIAARLHGKDSPSHATCLSDLAGLHADRRDYAAAEELLTQLAALRRDIYGKDDPLYSKTLIEQARVIGLRGGYDRTPPLIDEVLALARKRLKDDDLAYTNLLFDIGKQASSVGDYKMAKRCLEEAEFRPASREYAFILALAAELGEVYTQLGDYHKASSTFARAAQYRDRFGPDRPAERIQLLIRQADMLVRMGEFAQAEAVLADVAARQKASNAKATDPSNADSALVQGQIQLALGDPRAAGILFKNALELREKAFGNEDARTALALAQLGEFHSLQGRHEEGLAALQRAQKILLLPGQGANTSAAMDVTAMLGRAYYRKGDYTQARPLFLKVLAYLQPLGEESPRFLSTYCDLGLVYFHEGMITEAESALEHVHGGKPPFSRVKHIEYLGALARAHRLRGNIIKASLTQRTAMKLEQGMLRSVLSFSTEAQMQTALAGLGESLDVMVTITPLQGSTRLPGLAGDGATPIAETFGWALRRKGILLDTLCRFRGAQRLLEGDKELDAKVRHWRWLRQQLANAALSGSASATDAQKKQLAEWKTEADRLESEINRLASAQLVKDDDTSPDTVRAKLPTGSALVEILRVRPVRLKEMQPARYMAFVLPSVPKDPKNRVGGTTLVDLGAAEAIDELIGRFRAETQKTAREIRTTAEKDLEAELAKIGKDLHGRIFAPLEKHLDGASMLYIAPDGEMNRLPFEALVDADGKYLVERYKLAYLACGRDLLAPAAPSAKGTVVFAGPDYNLGSKERQAQAEKLNLKLGGDVLTLRGGISPELRGLRWKHLKGAAAEADDIEQALNGGDYGPVRSYRDGAAIEEAFKAMKPPRVLHLATHGFFLPEPRNREEPGNDDAPVGGIARLRTMTNPLLRSGIVLAGANALGEDNAVGEDGWLTAEEISLMNLRGTELVVLSACESGLGDVQAGQGVFGLRRAFLHAGARTLVSSLFEVPDAQTREMMHNFYGGMKGGKTKLDALRDAQLAMIQARRKEHQAAHPFFWASFILVGDPK